MGYVEFTREMKRDYTILVPNMLPMHFEMIVQVLRNYGYHLDLLRSSGHKIAVTVTVDNSGFDEGDFEFDAATGTITKYNAYAAYLSIPDPIGGVP